MTRTEFQRPDLYNVAWSLSSAPRVDSSPQPRSAGRKRKREGLTKEETEEETAPGAQDVWVVETLCGLKMKLKRQRVSSVQPEHHEAFTRLLGRTRPWRAPSNPSSKKNSNNYPFPIEKDSPASW